LAVYEDIARLVVEVEGSQSLDEAKQKVEQFSAALTGGGAGGAGGGHLQERVRSLAYAFQDFASAGGDVGQKLNAITNNIPGILAGFGSLATGIGVVVTAGVALYNNWDQVVRLFEEKKPFPEAERDLHRMNEELSAAQKEMKELEKNTSLTVDELIRYNELRTTQARVEKEIADQKERQKAVAEFERAEAPGAKVEERERAAMIQAALAPEKERLATDLAGQLRREALEEVGRLWQAAMKGGVATLTPEIEAAQARAGRAPAEAREILGRAFGGDVAAMERARGLLGVALTPAQQAAMEQATPEAFAARAEEADFIKRQREMAKVNEQVQRATEQKREQNARAMERAMAEEERELKEQSEADKKAAQAAQHAASVRQRQAHEEARVAEQRFGRTAELMAERGLVGGMTEAQVRGELARRFGRAGFGGEAAQEAALRATNTAMGRLTDLGGRGSELLRLNTEMTRQFAEQLHRQERALAEAARNLQAANQTNRKTGN
jgi:hypothetical protein